MNGNKCVSRSKIKFKMGPFKTTKIRDYKDMSSYRLASHLELEKNTLNSNICLINGSLEKLGQS